MKNRIKSLRIEKGLSQAELSEQIGCTQQALSKIEKGNRVPGVDLAIKIANNLMLLLSFYIMKQTFQEASKQIKNLMNLQNTYSD